MEASQGVGMVPLNGGIRGVNASRATRSGELDRPDRQGRAWVRLSQFAPLVLVSMPFLVLAIQLLVRRPDTSVYGDDALIDLAVLDALAGDRSAGVYSRFGFAHPGPIYFYLVAPVAAVTGTAPWALALGVQLIQGAAAVGLVETVRRRFDAGVAALSAAAVLLFVAALGEDVIKSPWNPLVVIIPMALYLVLVGTATSSWTQWCWALLVGTFLVQTNVGTVPIVAATGAVGALVAARRWYVDRSSEAPAATAPDVEHLEGATRPSARSLVLCAGLLGLTALAWLLPAVDLVRNGGDSNLAALTDSLRHGAEQWGPGPGVAAGIGVLGRELSTIVAGVDYGPTAEQILEPSDGGGLLPWVVVLLAVAGAAATIVVGRRRGQPALTQLGLVAAVALPVSAFAMTRVVGGLHWYVVLWSSAVAVPVLVGLGAAAWAQWSLDRRPIAGNAALAAAAIASVLAVTSVLGGPSWSTAPVGHDPSTVDWGTRAVDTAWAVVEPEVAGADTVRISGGNGIWWSIVAGLAVHLEQEGVDVQVDDLYLDKFGVNRAPDGTEDVRLLVATQGTKQAPPGAELLTKINGVPIYRVPIGGD